MTKMTNEEYIKYLQDMVMHRVGIIGVDKASETLEILEDLKGDSDLTLGDLRFLINVKIGSLLKSNCIEF